MELNKPAYVVSWTEYERGWGCRPDGYTLHPTKEDGDQFIKDHWDRQLKDHVPYEYSREDGPPQLCLVSEATFVELTEKKFKWINNRDKGTLFKM